MNKDRNLTAGLDYLIEGKHEKIIYGVLKRLHVPSFSVEFDDLVQEGRLAFAEAFVSYPDEPTESKHFGCYAYQAVYWRLLDQLRKATRIISNTENGSDEVLMEVLAPGTENAYDEVDMIDLMNSLLKRCSERERRFMELCCKHNLTGGEIAQREQISRQTIYQIRKSIKKKLDVLLKSKD